MPETGTGVKRTKVARPYVKREMSREVYFLTRFYDIMVGITLPMKGPGMRELCIY